MKNDRYFYITSAEAEKAVYRSIHDGIKVRSKNIFVSSRLSVQQIKDVYFKVIYDTPALYFVNPSEIVIGANSERFIINPSYIYTERETEKLDHDIEEVLKKIDTKANTFVSNPFRLEKYLHDSLVKSVPYDYDALMNPKCYNAHNIVGAFIDKKAVCDGISMAFKLLCNRYDMKCIVVVGDAYNGANSDQNFSHAWNLVKIGNGSYHVDVTWDNMTKAGIDKAAYDYFNLTTEDILKDHKPSVQVPVCTDTALNYFHSTDSFVGTFKELMALMWQRKGSPEIMFKIKPGSKFKSMDEVRNKTNLALSLMMVRRPAKLFSNDTQWIMKIYFL